MIGSMYGAGVASMFPSTWVLAGSTGYLVTCLRYILLISLRLACPLSNVECFVCRELKIPRHASLLCHCEPIICVRSSRVTIRKLRYYNMGEGVLMCVRTPCGRLCLQLKIPRGRTHGHATSEASRDAPAQQDSDTNHTPTILSSSVPAGFAYIASTIEPSRPPPIVKPDLTPQAYLSLPTSHQYQSCIYAVPREWPITS
jgi:hypothetical protein